MIKRLSVNDNLVFVNFFPDDNKYDSVGIDLKNL